MSRTTKQVVVITGASRGIGRATAERMARRGARLVLAARGEEALDAAARACERRGAAVLVVPTDVADPAQNQELVRRAVDEFGRIDVWVGAASVLAFGSVTDTPEHVYRRLVETNLLGQIDGVRAVLPHFRGRGRGRIVLVTSLYSRVSAPYLSAYAASKFGLLGFARALRQELLSDRRISIAVIQPATVDTAIFRRAANATGRRPHPLPPVVTPRRVARAIARAAAGRGPDEAVVGRVQSLAVPFARLAPRVYDRGMRAAMETLGLREGGMSATSGAVVEPDTDAGSVTGGWRSARARWMTALLAGAGLVLLARQVSVPRSPRVG